MNLLDTSTGFGFGESRMAADVKESRREIQKECVPNTYYLKTDVSKLTSVFTHLRFT